MTQAIIYPYGTKKVTVPVGQYIIIAAYEGDAKVYLGVSDPNMPTVYSYYSTVANTESTLGTWSAAQDVRIEAGAGKVYYNVGASPTISLPTPNTLAGTGDPFAVNGEAGTQGGAVDVTGGTSSTSANAGGAVAITGGTPGATGTGGAVTITSGAGGATSGVSGAVAVSSGSTTAASATGAVSIGSGAGAASAAATAGGASGTTTVSTGVGGANTGGATGEAGGAGGAMTVSTGDGGATNSAGAHDGGAGGDLGITAGDGGAASAGTGDGGAGGTVTITAGSGGTSAGGTAGVGGVIITKSVLLVNQGTPAAKTTSATLTAAEVLTGIITLNQGAGASTAQQLPLATAMDTALPDSAAGDAFDFSVVNISTNAAEDGSVTTNTGWTLVGNMDVASNAAATDKSAGRFRARKTGAGAWSLYRLS
jgi:hypothetical protein